MHIYTHVYERRAHAQTKSKSALVYSRVIKRALEFLSLSYRTQLFIFTRARERLNCPAKVSRSRGSCVCINFAAAAAAPCAYIKYIERRRDADSECSARTRKVRFRRGRERESELTKLLSPGATVGRKKSGAETHFTAERGSARKIDV